MENEQVEKQEKKSRGRPKKTHVTTPQEHEISQKADAPEPKIKLKSVNYSQPSRNNTRTHTKVRKTVVYEEEREDHPDPYMEEKVTFVFRNEEQRGIPQFWLYYDKWSGLQGMMYDGQKYTLPRKVYMYLKDRCVQPEYSNVEREIIPGQSHRISEITGYKKRFDLQLVA